jgi:hypothetical protein
MAAGYSGTPLAKKLGISADSVVVPIDAPPELREWLAPVAPRFAAHVDATTDIAHAFVTEQMALQRHLQHLRKRLRDDATVWVSWPKKASKVATDVTEDTVRDAALPLGFVDVKVCAVSETWSGLKLVVRRELRKGGRAR